MNYYYDEKTAKILQDIYGSTVNASSNADRSFEMTSTNVDATIPSQAATIRPSTFTIVSDPKKSKYFFASVIPKFAEAKMEQKPKVNSMDETDLKIKVLTAEINGQLGRFEDRIEQAIAEMRRDSTRAESNWQSLENKISNMKWWMIGTGLSVVLGIASFNATVLSNMVASFDSGRDTSAMIEKSAQDLKSASELLGKVQASLAEQEKNSKGLQAPPGPPSQPANSK